MGDENLLDILGRVQQKDIVGTKPDVRDRPEFRTRLRQKGERIAPNLEKIAKEYTPAGPGGEHTRNLTLRPAN